MFHVRLSTFYKAKRKGKKKMKGVDCEYAQGWKWRSEQAAVYFSIFYFCIFIRQFWMRKVDFGQPFHSSHCANSSKTADISRPKRIRFSWGAVGIISGHFQCLNLDCHCLQASFHSTVSSQHPQFSHHHARNRFRHYLHSINHRAQRAYSSLLVPLSLHSFA